MAEKPEDQFSSEEKITKAKELYARGCRNFYVKSYTEAADDLSEASKLLGEEHGVDADELGDVYLMYARALVSLGQEENKLIDVPEEDADDSEEEPCEEQENGKEEMKKENGHSEEPKAGTSRGEENDSSNDAKDEDEQEEEADDGGNLELAWEVLLNAESIFERQGAKGLKNLMDVYVEMGGISLENGNFETAVKDFSRGLDVFIDLEEVDQNIRITAEIHYKIGLCQSMLKQYDESVKSFQKSVQLLDEVLLIEKAKPQQTDDVKNTISDLEETQQEIQNKITEIGETKAEEIEQVKKELAKMFGPSTASENSDGAGSSLAGLSSSPKPVNTDKPKATDISHLIKRKKPDAPNNEESPAKKKAIEHSSNGPKSVDVIPEDKISDTEVQVISK